MRTETEIFEQLARNAAPGASSGAIPASPSISTRKASSGIAGTAAFPGANTSGDLSPAAAQWAQSARNLSRGTLARLGVVSGSAFFPRPGKSLDALFFPYAGGWKARAFPAKEFVASKGLKGSFFNLAAVLASNPARVYICEGELDACALVESGIDAGAVLSVPTGAKERPAEEPADARGSDYVRDALAAGLNRAKQIVWCGDGDGPGLTLRADMARLFGAAKFFFLDWPEHCKDANDTLRMFGAQAAREWIESGVKPWPVNGLFRMSELPEPAPMTLWKPGFAEWESKVFLAPRCMSVVTGHPGHGKTELWAQIWHNVARDYDVPVCVATFETRAKPHYRRKLRSYHSGKLEIDMTPEEIAKADAWIDDRYLFAAHPEHRPTLAWFLDMAEVAVIRHGARIIQLDPWNRMEAARGERESETDYIGRCLREIHAFAHDLNCHVQILAHPAKMDGKRKGEPPSLEDISGSKNWDNMVDQGFVVHRDKLFEDGQRRTDATLFHRKARFEELGYPCALGLDYDVKRARYRSTDYRTGYGA